MKKKQKDIKEINNKIIKNTNTNYIPRTPILLNKNTVALIHMFERYDKLEDIWMIDTNYLLKSNPYENAAKQFIHQLEDHWCDAFIEELAIELIKTYKKSRSRTGDDNDFKKLLERIKKI